MQTISTNCEECEKLTLIAHIAWIWCTTPTIFWAMQEKEVKTTLLCNTLIQELNQQYSLEYISVYNLLGHGVAQFGGLFALHFLTQKSLHNFHHVFLTRFRLKGCKNRIPLLDIVLI